MQWLLIMMFAAAVEITTAQQLDDRQDIRPLVGGQTNGSEAAGEQLPTEHYRVLSDPEGVRLTRPIYR